MDSCARGAFLSGVGFLVSLKWLQAARVSISAVATQRIRIDRRGALSVSMCIGWLLVPEPRRLTSVCHRSERLALGEVISSEMRDITTLSQVASSVVPRFSHTLSIDLARCGGR